MDFKSIHSLELSVLALYSVGENQESSSITSEGTVIETMFGAAKHAEKKIVRINRRWKLHNTKTPRLQN